MCGLSEAPEGDTVLLDLVRVAVERAGTSWRVHAPTDGWCLVEPAGHEPREQGWKIHVSATPVSAPLVLARAAAVLVRRRCAFKYAATLDDVAQLAAPECPRGSGGKFITCYPADDDEFRRLLPDLHDATDGLPGPVVLSDRAFRAGSLVHYRYGAFTGVTVLGNDGGYECRLRRPDGELVTDHRDAWYHAPSWAEAPLPEVTGNTPRSDVVLLDGRFEVRAALQHGNKGGVFAAVDRPTGAEVVIKQARAHVAGLLDGSDARDLLRNEADMMDRLAGTGRVPLRLGMFQQQGDLFLVQERLPGRSLSSWAYERMMARLDGPGEAIAALTLDDVLPVAAGLLELLDTVHAAGLVVRDLSPGNVMVAPDGSLRLIDLEHVIRPGTRVAGVGTPGFVPPEAVPVGSFGPAPAAPADRYAAGCLLLHLVTGAGLPAAPDEQQLAELITRMGRVSTTVRALAPALLGLCRDAAAARWTTARAREFLSGLRPRPGTSAPARRTAAGDLTVGDLTVGDLTAGDLTAADLVTATDRGAPAALDALLRDGLAQLTRTIRPASPTHLWPVSRAERDSDPGNLQSGAAGPLAVLTRACAVHPGQGDALRATVATAAGWLDRRLPLEPTLLPGLYFGRAGAAWALFDAARLLGDDDLAARALDWARRLPIRWPNPDVAHGTAGAGLGRLALWSATGDDQLADQIHSAAEHLVSTVSRPRAGEVCWPIPVGFDSTLAGLTHYGFAHGVAGVGSFLLAAGLALADERFLELAHQAGKTLLDVAHRPGDAAWWPVGEEEDRAEPIRMAHWCSGSSGVGSFLLRLWQHDQDARYRDLAEAAAVAVRRVTWQAGPMTCHGLAGDGQFLLDLAQALDDARYLGWAQDLVTPLRLSTSQRDGRLLVEGEDHAGYQTGLAGMLDFLLRLRHGGPRPWLPLPVAGRQP